MSMDADPSIWSAAAISAALTQELAARASRPIRPPTLRSAKSIQSELTKAGVRLLWADDPAYPTRAMAALGEPAPWMFVAGDAAKLAAPQIAVVGSRETAPPLLRAAERLGAALSARGIVVTSGLAPGADQAAHAGALAPFAKSPGPRSGVSPRSAVFKLHAPAPVGGLAVPARGILPALAESPFAPPAASGLAWLGLGRPEDPFGAGLAIRRNHAMAALAEGVVLVASRATGGSLYAVNWALANGKPVWAFEAGSRTPAANAALIRSGRARALPLRESPEDWAELVSTDAAREKKQRRRPAPTQLEMLG